MDAFELASEFVHIPPSPLWQILICTIPHRDTMLRQLLAELDAQIGDGTGVQVIVARDDLEHSYGDKMQHLFEAATAKYISVIDDDDWVSPRYIEAIWLALQDDVDYVGYQVDYLVDGKHHMFVDHSLRHGRWLTAFGVEGQDDLILRDISEKNPIRRTMALWGQWEGGYGADERWAALVRKRAAEERDAGHTSLDIETYIAEPLYYYRYQTGGHFQTARKPMGFRMDPLPPYRWLITHELGTDYERTADSSPL